jgi:hypothetical protein
MNSMIFYNMTAQGKVLMSSKAESNSVQFEHRDLP